MNPPATGAPAPLMVLDHITTAVNRAKVYGESEIRSYFHRCMTEQDRVRFDLFLVKTDDPLAWQAGTCESRFYTRCHSMFLATQAANPQPLAA